jgi:hypothetical protein
MTTKPTMEWAVTWRLIVRVLPTSSGDRNPWYVLRQASWADPALLKYGYVPVSHDGGDYYCLIRHEPFLGTRIAPGAYFICGDSADVSYTLGIRFGLGTPP